MTADSDRAPENAGRETVAGALARVRAVLHAADVGDGPDEARRLVALAAGLSPLALITDPGCRLSAAECGHLDALLARRCRHEPLSRLVGCREFYGRPFRISPATLDPRADSETLIGAALELIDGAGWRECPLRILDVGTGTGCLILTLLAELPEASGVGTDISQPALEIAGANAAALGLAPRVRFELGDALDPPTVTQGAAWPSAANPFGPFDLLVSNPPYIPSRDIAGLDREVRDFDPLAALDGGPDGLQIYRRIFAGLAAVVPAGFAVVEVGAGQAEAVVALAGAAVGRGATGFRMWRDLGGHARAVAIITRRPDPA